MKKLFCTFVIFAILVGCGGGGNSSDTGAGTVPADQNQVPGTGGTNNGNNSADTPNSNPPAPGNQLLPTSLTCSRSPDSPYLGGQQLTATFNLSSAVTGTAQISAGTPGNALLVSDLAVNGSQFIVQRTAPQIGTFSITAKILGKTATCTWPQLILPNSP